MSSNSGNLSFVNPFSGSSHIVVGSGHTLHVTRTGTGALITSTSSLQLGNVLLSPSLIKNLLSVRQLCRDNPVSVEFDAVGFSVKDIRTRNVIFHSDSDGDFYPVAGRSPPRSLFAGVVTVDLGTRDSGIPANLRFGAVYLHFSFSVVNLVHVAAMYVVLASTRASLLVHHKNFPFQLLHMDVWASPVVSISDYQFYLFILDDYTHYIWSVPLKQKSVVFSILS
jgi:hypothetical protein